MEELFSQSSQNLLFRLRYILFDINTRLDAQGLIVLLIIYLDLIFINPL